MFDLQFSQEVFISMLKGIPTTITVSLIAFIFSLFLAVFIAIVDYFNVPIIKHIFKIYVSFFRGTPLLVQLFFIYFGLPNIIPALKNMSPFLAIIIGLTLNTAAYMKETIRGAIMSVESGQIEAALSLGMTNLQTMTRIILPQAAKIAVPSIANSFIDIIKGSALAFSVGVIEITAIAKMTCSSNFKYFEAYLALMILYWLIIMFFEKCQSILENRLNSKY